MHRLLVITLSLLICIANGLEIQQHRDKRDTLFREETRKILPTSRPAERPITNGGLESRPLGHDLGAEPQFVESPRRRRPVRRRRPTAAVEQGTREPFARPLAPIDSPSIYRPEVYNDVPKRRPVVEESYQQSEYNARKPPRIPSGHAPYQEPAPPRYEEENKIPGVPGKDYPTYHQAPETSFNCEKVPVLPGMYANVETGCQAYHICDDGRYGPQGATFLCINGTVFNQAAFTCDWWFNVNCAEATNHYNLNADRLYNPFYRNEELKRLQAEEGAKSQYY
ncbi:unnamed protein product [Darwinula stevensoni]|uniref:Chitin-binding type-2 domain-containing protein n=1 Tax=Darwinula stevensoni TaxID=69355 RepID=A0A7R8X0C0_9CRUS|nr:unnamed protein product [Darwinula stevensoni]CAG0880972.1 unnamed protein product [Darwinula stevensoni]